MRSQVGDAETIGKISGDFQRAASDGACGTEDRYIFLVAQKELRKKQNHQEIRFGI